MTNRNPAELQENSSNIPELAVWPRPCLGSDSSSAGVCHWPGWHSTGGCLPPQMTFSCVELHHQKTPICHHGSIKPNSISKHTSLASYKLPRQSGGTKMMGKFPPLHLLSLGVGLLENTQLYLTPGIHFQKSYTRNSQRKNMLVMLLIFQQGCSPELAAHAPAAEPSLALGLRGAGATVWQIYCTFLWQCLDHTGCIKLLKSFRGAG